LALVDTELAACVSCGLCLPHCPTWRVTGDESKGPRGRIALMREVEWNGAALDETFVESMATCVQCRGCETACPSGVPYGALIEGTRTALAQNVPVARPAWWLRLGLQSLHRHRLLAVGARVGAVLQWARLVPRRLGVPVLPLRQPRLRSTGTDVWLYVGCVMDVMQREVHAATQRVIESTGTTVQIAPGGCCGALSAHAGLDDDARAKLRRTMASMPGGAAILVNSAGCGAALKDAGHLLGTADATVFAARVFDIHEWLADRVDLLPQAAADRVTVAVQDPCHLRHVQRVHEAQRVVLRRYVDVVELDDDGLCCGAGGSYSLLQPELAGAIRDRKVASIERSATMCVTSANPGCAMHLSPALAERHITVEHPMVVIDRAIR
jgi:glycolate oxidase iron-sulfur subunit